MTIAKQTFHVVKDGGHQRFGDRVTDAITLDWRFFGQGSNCASMGRILGILTTLSRRAEIRTSRNAVAVIVAKLVAG